MAYGNDVIDLLALAADKFVSSGAVSGNDIILTLTDGSTVTIAGAVSDPDIFVTNMTINAANELVTTMSDGTIHTVDLTVVPDEHVISGTVAGAPTNELTLNMSSGATVVIPIPVAASTDKFVIAGAIDVTASDLVLTMNDATTVSIDLSMLEDVHVQAAAYNCVTEAIDLIMTDGSIVTIDMTCFATSMSALERGGVAFDAAKTYAPGDIVGAAGQAYISLTGASSSPAANPADWAPLTVAERGGVLYLPTNTYSVGDMVSSAGIGYISLTGLSSDPATNPTDWITVASDERGGIAHDMTLSYVTGDTVIRNNRLYIAQAANTGVDPAGDPVTWREYNTVMHTAVLGGSAGGSLHNPTGDAYPAPTGETIGATWTVNGLGAGTAYTYGAGSLAGVVVKDGDYLSWVEGPDTAPVWLHIPKAVMTAERGGVAWSTATDYLAGDIVVDPIDGEIYKCIAGSLATVTPPSLSIEWTRSTVDERAGMVYDPTVQYEIGDVVSIGDELYIIGEDPANPGNPMPIGGNPSNPADSSTPDAIGDEVGGIAWDTTTAYEIGDVVSEGVKLYICIVANNGNQPSIAPGAWTLAESALVVERGGVAFDVLQPYVVGDIVTDGVGPSIYVCILANTGDNPALTPTSWYDATSQFTERGGVAWDPTISYIIGDVAVQNTQLYIARINTVNDNPGISPTEWELHGVERGGVQWRVAQNYTANDLAVDNIDGFIYRAVISQAGNQPSTDGGVNWVIASAPERGGVLWKTTEAYIVGDVVVDTIDNFMYRAVAIQTGNQPSTDVGTNWVIAASPERGGVLFDALEVYVPGDIIGIIDATLPAPLDTEMRTWVCHTGVGPLPWSGVTNWSDTADGGTY